MIKLKPHDTKLFHQVNKITKSRHPMPPLKLDTCQIFHSADKSEVIADNFEKVHQQNLNLGDPEHNQHVTETVDAWFLNYGSEVSSCPEMPTLTEVQDTIKVTKNKKAPGQDNITNTILKHVTAKYLFFIFNIVTIIFKNGIFPTNWKNAIVLPIPKAGKDPHNPKSYRPISLLSSISKIVEKLIATRLRSELIARNVIQKEQFGFQPKCSTAHALQHIKNDIQSGLKQKKDTAMVMLDMEKAFDTVCHYSLLYKMIKLNISPYLIKLIQSYLKERSFQVKLDGSLSRKRRIAAGIPQGSILGPLLFTLYMHDLPKHPRTKFTIFADDTSIRCSDKNPRVAISYLQQHLDILSPYYVKWKMKINEDKSEYIMFSRKRNLPELQQMSMNGQQIQRS